MTIVSGGAPIVLADVEAEASVSIIRGAISAAVTAQTTWDHHAVQVAAAARYAGGVLAAPYALASLDDARVTALGISFAPDAAVSGAVAAVVPSELAATFAKRPLPGNVALTVVASRDGTVDARVAVGATSVHALAHADLVGRHANVFAVVEVPDAAALESRLTGHGLVTAALDVRDAKDGGHLRGVVTADGVYPFPQRTLGADEINATSFIGVDATLDQAWLMIQAGSDVGQMRSTTIAELARKDGTITLTRATVDASARSLRDGPRAIQWLGANVRAKGRLWPAPDLRISGAVDASGLRNGALSAANVHVQIDDAVHAPSVAARAHLVATGLRNGTTPIGSATIDSHAKRAKDGTITVAIDSHSITSAANGVWSGRGGVLTIDPTTITLRDLRTGNGGGKIDVSAKVTRATSDLSAKLDATDVALGALVPEVRGQVVAHATVSRRGARWDAEAKVHGAQVEAAGRPPVDIDADVKVAGRRVTAKVDAKGALGGASVAVDVEGPRELTDVAAWKRLDRKALRDATVELAKIDLAKSGTAGATGVIDGKIQLTATETTGAIQVRGVETKAGTVEGDVTLAQSGALITSVLAARLAGVDTVDGTANLAIPVRLFDPAAWRTLGRGVLQHATLHVQPFAFDSTMLAKHGVNAPYSGHAEVTVDIGMPAVRRVDAGCVRRATRGVNANG